jgi:predicted ATP-grasp superfamily ATP-dependent carboligase
VRPAVLLSASAASMLRSAGRIAAKAEIIIIDASLKKWLRVPSRVPSEFEATFLIAPECDKILVSLLKLLQGDKWEATCSLNVPWSMARIFADKYRTFEWLQKRGIPTPTTKTLDDAAYDRLNSDMSFQLEDFGSCDGSLPVSPRLVVMKPRDGVGCDHIHLIPMRKSRFDRQPPVRFADDPWVLQRFLPGVPCSVGFIGGGSVRPTLILPPALQDIRLDDQEPRYYGGQIPCSPDIVPAIDVVAQQLARELGSFSGYVGADLVVTRDSHGNSAAHVIEVNPRLCTSYVGYRLLARDNLAACLVGQSFDRPLRWHSGGVRFDSAGNAARVDDIR